MKNNIQFSRGKALIILLGILIATVAPGCGGDKKDSWLKNDGDYLRVVERRAMTMVWGVIIDIENCTAESGTIENSGEIGETPEESDASVRMIVGNVTVDMKTTKKDNFEFRVNDKLYGRVKTGQRVLIDQNRIVEVNGKVREPK